jgi:hypothetical protein
LAVAGRADTVKVLEGVTVNEAVVVADPVDLVTVIGPVAAPGGMVKPTEVALRLL